MSTLNSGDFLPRPVTSILSAIRAKLNGFFFEITPLGRGIGEISRGGGGGAMMPFCFTEGEFNRLSLIGTGGGGRSFLFTIFMVFGPGIPGTYGIILEP